MAGLPATVGVLEVGDENRDRVVLEPQSREALACLLARHRGNARVAKRTVGQPRSCATRRSARSGFTATGLPTASRNGTSECESEYAVELPELDPALLRELDESVRLRLPVQPALEPAGEDAVARLGTGRDRAVEAEPVGDLLHDFLQCRRRDEHRLATTAVSFRAVERLAIDQRLEHGLPGLGGDLAHELHRQPAKNRHRAVGRLPHTSLSGSEPHENELCERRLDRVATTDQPTRAKRPRQRERARVGDQRPVEVEEGSPRFSRDRHSRLADAGLAEDSSHAAEPTRER